MAQDAVIRNFEIISEATKRIDHEVRQQHPKIPWRAMPSFRDVLIHDYAGIDLTEVWNVVVNDMPSSGYPRTISSCAIVSIRVRSASMR